MPDTGFGYRVGEKGGGSSGLLDSVGTKGSGEIGRLAVMLAGAFDEPFLYE